MLSLPALVGRQSIAFARYLGGLAEMFSKATYWTFVAPFRGKGVRWDATVRQMVVVGFQAVPIVSLICAFVGIIIALQGAYELRKFGALNYVVDMVAITVTRELAPLLTAIIVIGRSGSAFAAEIGTMEVGEEVDALETMGLNPIRFLVVPKYLAMLVMMPCLTVVADTAGVLGGAFFAITNLDSSLSGYLQATVDSLLLRDIVTGLIKSEVFAVIITKIGCYEGFSVRGGAEGVGRSTTSAVVKSIFSVIAADMIFTAIFYFTNGS
jgi:phospholipid/cholesterol/gamma-HCH transport system permease protein